MPSCPRCHAQIHAGAAYCAACGRPRITESLRVPVVQSDRQKRWLQAAIAVGTLWLLVTTGVAFLREAKAVRVGRNLLAEGKAKEAWTALDPFLVTHPRHQQALFLGGKAAIRLGLNAEAKSCLTTLGERSPKLAAELGIDYRQVLTAQTRAESCGSAESFSRRLDLAGELGDAYVASIVDGLDAVVEACYSNPNDNSGPGAFVAALAERNLAVKMAEKGYAPVLGRALAEARYGDAYALAQQGVGLVPDGEVAIKQTMDGERRKVQATKNALRQACDRIKSEAQNRPRCFPATAPPHVGTVRDGWGKAILYQALEPDEQGCHHGFALTSLGGDGVLTEDRTYTPADEMTCRFFYGRETWQLPQPYWQIATDRGR